MTDLLEMKGITKVYDNGVIANEDINFSLRKGEIHALVGENGAGKSTLMKILFGMEKPTKGQILLNGSEIQMSSSNDAIKYGIGMVHQHFMLVSSFSIAENIVLGMEPKKRVFIDFDEAVNITKALSEKYNLVVEPYEKVDNLSVGMKQKVEILKALYRGAEILILDEPTAVLTPQETKELFEQLKYLKDQGHTIVFISHKLKEVKEISERITIMKKGKTVGTYKTSDVTEEEISKLMVGYQVSSSYDKKDHSFDSSVLKVQDLNYTNEIGKKVLKNVSFSVRAGEILGIAGVEGNGQRELVEIIAGKRESQNSVKLNGKDIENMSIKEIRDLGLCYIPEDRMTTGTAVDGSIKDNIISSQYDNKSFNNKLFMDNKKIDSLSDKLIEEFDIKCSGNLQKIRMLSGGNMQKVVVARECFTNPVFLIADQPTRGVDIGAAKFIKEKLVELRNQGTGVLLVSADLNEVMELSDSLLVMYEGEIVAYFEDVSSITEEELGLYMLGVKCHEEERIRRATHE